MSGVETGVDPIVSRVRNLQTAAWLRSSAEIATGLFLCLLTKDRMTVHASASGQMLLSVEWHEAGVIVCEFEPQPAKYRFSDVPTALTFLNAILMRYVVDLTEQPTSAKHQSMPGLSALYGS